MIRINIPQFYLFLFPKNQCINFLEKWEGICSKQINRMFLKLSILLNG